MCLCSPNREQPSCCMCREQVSENIEQNAQDLFEEMGVETDETAGASLAQVQQLMPKRARR